jgi:hypothetical protein
MEWSKKGSSWVSEGYAITTLPQYGSTQDYFAIHHIVAGAWFPVTNPKTNRHLYRRTLEAAQAWCDDDAKKET